MERAAKCELGDSPLLFPPYTSPYSDRKLSRSTETASGKAISVVLRGQCRALLTDSAPFVLMAWGPMDRKERRTPHRKRNLSINFCECHRAGRGKSIRCEYVKMSQ